MDYQQSVDWIHGQYGLGHKHGLNNERILLHRLGNPQDQFPSVHVAGTNGKGSTCAMLSCALQACGLRVGLYTSPFLTRYNERIRINGRDIPDADLARIATRVREHSDALAQEGVLATVFELGTACAFAYFAQQKVDVAVIEVGLGGRLDPTNVITPLVSVIAHIGLDHEKVLGSTIEQIAMEKAGIIKDGIPCVFYPGQPQALAVTRKVCAEHNAPLLDAESSTVSRVQSDAYGHRFDFAYNGWSLPDVHIPLPGSHQIDNARTVLTALHALRAHFTLPDDRLRKGLAATVWPGRLQWIDGMLLDGAHNTQGAEALCAFIRTFLPDRRIIGVCGILRDKAVQSIVETLTPVLDAAICLAPDSPRATSAQELCNHFEEQGMAAQQADSLADALTQARMLAEPDGIVVICGSLYLVGEALNYIGSKP